MDAHRRTCLGIGIALAIITLAVFGQVAWFDFIEFDDPSYVTNFPLVKGGLTAQGVREAFTTLHGCNWHPLTWLSLMADWQFFGKNAGAFHLVNLGLHLANVLLLFAALQHMAGQPWRSGLVAALFAIHPLHVESVAWVSERKDVLSTLFWMLALWSYSHYARGRSLRWYLVVFVSLALGLMAKPMLVTLPCVLLLLDYWPLGRWSPSGAKRDSQADEQRPRRAGRRQPPEPITAKPDEPRHQVAGSSPPASLKTLIVEKLPLFALVAASCVATLYAQKSAMAPLTNMSLPARLSNAVLSYVGYLGQTFWPVNLACYYPYSSTRWTHPAPILSTLFLVGATFAAVKARRYSWLLVGWLWYVGTLVPVIGLVQVGGQAMADRYTYVPLIGIFLVVAWSIPARLPDPQQRLVKATAALILGGLLILCWKQVGYWRNSFTLFEHALAVTDKNWMAHINLGIAWQKKKSSSEAEQRRNSSEAQRHLHEALRITSRCAEAHSILADIAARSGDFVTAQAHAREAIRYNPNLPEAQGVLGLCLAREGKPAEAVPHFRAAVRLVGDNPLYRFNLASALADSGELSPAVEEYLTVIRLQPGNANAHYELGCLHALAGRSQQAIDEWRLALKYNPQHDKARQKLAEQLSETRKK